MIEIGKKAPDFCLYNQNNKKIKLKSFKDQWVILYFYPKDNTSGCTKEAIDFTALINKFKKKNAVILGVSPDGIDSHKKFKEKNKLGIELLSNPEKTVLKKYDAWGIKKNYGKEYEGVIRSTILISPEGVIKEIWRKVKVRVKKKDREIKHAEKVFEKLGEIQ